MNVGRWLVSGILLATMVLAVPAAHATYEPRSSSAQAPTSQGIPSAHDRLAGQHNTFARRVAITGNRRVFLECRGTGSPTVVLEAGSGNLADVWTMQPFGKGRAVMPAVARFTRVCAYDRPGTYLDGKRSRSDPVVMPRSARDIVRDLHAVLRAAKVPGPYVLAGHSFGGMVARLYATLHPARVVGLVSIDAQNEGFVAVYKRLLIPELYLQAVLNPQPPPGLEGYAALERLSLETSAAQMRQAQADTPLRRMPVVVISHSRDLPNPFGFPSDWPLTGLESAFQKSQGRLATLVPGTRHWIAARSGHYIHLDEPKLVISAIRSVVTSYRSSPPYATESFAGRS